MHLKAGELINYKSHIFWSKRVLDVQGRGREVGGTGRKGRERLETTRHVAFQTEMYLNT